MEQKSPSFASTRDDEQLDAGRKLQQPAWHGSVCRQMTSFWRPTHERMTVHIGSCVELHCSLELLIAQFAFTVG